MKILRVLCLILVIGILVPAVCGCHGSRALDPFVMPDGLDMTREYEITFWAKNDTNIQQTRIYKKAIEDFQALYPNIRVNLRLYTDYGKIYNDVITNIATNTTPNVCITYPDHIATYRTGKNIVVPLDTLFTDEKYGLGGSEVKFDSPTVEEIVPQFLAECVLDGAYYAIPFMRSTEACYINKTFVEKLGYTVPDILTWDFIWEVSDAAAAKDEDGTYLVNGQKVMRPFIYKSTDNMMIQMLCQRGAGYSLEDGTIEIFNDVTEDLLYTVAAHVAQGAFTTFKIDGYPGNFFNAGQCIFGVDSTAGASWIGSNAPLSDISDESKVEFETVVRPIPQFDPENPQMISQGPSVCVFNKENPQEVLASWLFAQFLLTSDVQIAYAQTEGYVPVTTKAQNDASYQDYLSRSGEDNETYYSVKIDAAKLLLAHTENTFVTPVFNGSVSLRDASGQMIENVTKSVRRKETVDEAYIEKLFGDMTSLYRLDQHSEQGGDGGKAELGELPVISAVLLGSLAFAWVCICLCAVTRLRKKVKK